MGIFRHVPVHALDDCTQNWEQLEAEFPLASGFVNIQEYGAVASPTIDNGPAFEQATIDLQSKGGGTLWIPRGHYGISSYKASFINGNVPINLLGEGRQAVILEKLGEEETPVISWSGGGANLVSNSSIRGITIVAKANCPGIRFESIAWLDVDSVVVADGSVGIEANGVVDLQLLARLEGNKEGLVLQRNATHTLGATMVAVRRGSVISGNKISGITADYCSSILIEADMEANGEVGNTETGAIRIGKNLGKPPGFGYGIVTINNSWLEVNKGRSITAESGEIRIRDTLILATDTGTLGTEGRDVFITGTATRFSMENSQMPSVVGASTQLWIDHECTGTIKDTVKNTYTIPGGVTVQEGPTFTRLKVKSKANAEALAGEIYLEGEKMHYKDGAGTVHVITSVP